MRNNQDIIKITRLLEAMEKAAAVRESTDDSYENKGWIGVDLDGTLAKYNDWISPFHIGSPVHRMVERVKGWLREGKDVRIVTARVSPQNDNVLKVRAAIQLWLKKYIGTELPVTNEKDFAMTGLWDDRAVQVIPNTGERADGEEG